MSQNAFPLERKRVKEHKVSKQPKVSAIRRRCQRIRQLTLTHSCQTSTSVSALLLTGCI